MLTDLQNLGWGPLSLQFWHHCFKTNKSIILGVKWKLRNENESWVLQVLTYFLCLSQWHLQKWILKLLISTPLQSAAASLSAHTGLIYQIYRKLSTTYSDPKKLQLVGMSSRWNFLSWKGSDRSRAKLEHFRAEILCMSMSQILGSKGQLILKRLFGVIFWTKIATKILSWFLPWNIL